MTTSIRAARLLLGLFAAIALAGGLAVANLSPSQLWSTTRLILYVVAPLLLGLIAGTVAIRRPALSPTFLIYLACTGIALQLAEVVLARTEPAAAPATGPAIAATAPTHFCPGTLPGAAGSMAIAGRATLPLTGLSNSPVGEGLDGKVRQTDERGLKNPAGLWSQAPVDVVAVGDSFTFGADVPIGAGFVDRIRARIPSTINLGCGGNDPLAELAGLVEYGTTLRPRVVLWVFYEGNDLTKNILNELKSPVLSRYLDPTFRQDLVLRQQEIDDHLRGFLQQRPPSALAPTAARGIDVFETVTLSTLRTRLGLRHAYGPTALDAFDKTLMRAVVTVKGWGGRLVFVYLPAETRFASSIARADARGYAAKVQEVAAKYGVPIIDVAASLESESNPRSLFRGHFTVEGYAKTAEIILKDLVARRLLRR